MYDENIPANIFGVDLVYCESTFKKDLSKIAVEKQHCTTTDAARIAYEANAGRLLIGHFSARYDDDELETLEEEAKEIFPNTELAKEGLVFRI